tara:strand:- start:1324 stop:1590 length:267 start_codon:yes stop_codon:yes gene_type:complete
MSDNHHWYCASIRNHLTIEIMKKNMGSADKAVRILLTVAIAILYFGNIVTGTLGIVLLALAAVFLLTSLVSFCPLYTLVGLNTCPAKK